MPRRRVIKHEETMQVWHLDGSKEGERRGNLIMGLAEEEDFNDPSTNSFPTDELELVCFQLGFL